MKNTKKVMTTSLLMALMCAAAATMASAKHVKANGQLAVRDVLTADISKDVTGRFVKRQADVEAMNVISDVKAQISDVVDGVRHIRFVAAIDSNMYDQAKFNIVVKNGDEVVKTYADKEVTTAYTHIEAGGKVLSAAEAFGDEKYNYMIAYTIKNVPEEAWGYTFEASVAIKTADAEDFTVSEVANKTINKVAIAELAGTYKGANVYNASSATSVRNLVIDEDGNISGTKSGVINSYDSTTGEVKWTPKGKNVEYTIVYNNGALLTPYSDSGSLPNTDVYLFMKDVDITSAKTRGFVDNKSRIVEFVDSNGESHFVYINNTEVHPEVTMSSVMGPLSVENLKTGSVDVTIYDSNGNSLYKTGFVGGTETALDTVCGVYKDQNGVEFILNGLGNVVVNNVTGTYKVNGDVIEVLVDNTYYHLTLNENTCESVKPMVDVVLVTGEGHTQYGTLNVNDNTNIELPVPQDAGYVFNGWFYDAEFTQPAVGAEESNYAVKGGVTLYAKFSSPVSLTINYNNGADSETIVYSLNDVPNTPNPTRENMAFGGWYTTPTFDEGTRFDPTQPLTVNTVIYAKWDEAPIYANTYNGVGNFDNNSPATGGTENSSGWNNASVTINPDSTATGTAYPFRGDITISDYNPETGTAVMDVGTTHYPVIYVDSEMGILVIPRYRGELNNVLVAIPGAEHKVLDSNFKCSHWDSGYTKAISYTSDYITFNLFIYDGNVHFFVSFVDDNGNPIAAQDAYNSKSLHVLDKDGNEIVQFAHDGKTMRETDGRQGTYTNGDDTLVLNGVDKAVVNGVEGTYVSTDDRNIIGVYVNGEYFDVTLNGATFTSNKPMVTVTYVAGEYATVAPVTVNKNIEIELPNPTNDNYVFKGWYLDADLTQAVEGNYVPTADVTLYARWEEKVLLTVNYGNGLETVVNEYAIGDTVALEEPGYTNGKVFEGWYLDAEFTQPYTSNTIMESTIIYCKWVDSIALYGSYSGFETWGSTPNGSTSWGANSSSSCSLEIDPQGNTTGKFTGKIADYNSETGTFKIYTSETKYYYGYYDAKNGAIAVNYTSDIEELGNDYYLMFKDATPAYDGSNAFVNSYWNSGYSRLIELKLTNAAGEVEEVVVFIHENVIYYNVTFTSPTDGDISAANAYTATDLVVYDAEGNVIATR